ncbi:MAG: DUF2179 domain-containing protein [Bacteroidales bacterium]|nr:DUF2179 domain-containing protein [Bacteroidales bacterium]
MDELMNLPVFTWVIIPLLIFIARVMDVSIGTLRLIFIAKGFKLLAPILGFFEVIIWLLAISQIMQQLNNFMCYIAYGLGFAAGNYIGIVIDEKMSIGNVIVRVFPKENTMGLIDHLRENNFGVTAIDVEGKSGKYKMLFSIIKRKDAKEYIGMVNHFNPNVFYTVEDIKSVGEGYFRSSRQISPFSSFYFLRRKGK